MDEQINWDEQIDWIATAISNLQRVDVANDCFQTVGIKIVGYNPPSSDELDDDEFVPRIKECDQKWAQLVDKICITFKFIDKEYLRKLDQKLQTHGLRILLIKHKTLYIPVSGGTRAFCKWPDGQIREVMAFDDENSQTRIIWNEAVNSDCKAVTGFDETVPTKWLEYLGDEL